MTQHWIEMVASGGGLCLACGGWGGGRFLFLGKSLDGLDLVSAANASSYFRHEIPKYLYLNLQIFHHNPECSRSLTSAVSVFLGNL